MEKYLGLILIIIALIISSRFSNEYKVLNYGKEVDVNVINVPLNCLNSKGYSRAYFKFEYLGKSYTKNIIGEKYCNLIKPNIKLKLLTDKDYSVFMFPNENLRKEIISAIILFLAGLFIFLKGFIKVKRIDDKKPE